MASSEMRLLFGQINVLPIKKDKARQATGDSRPHVVTAYRRSVNRRSTVEYACNVLLDT